MIRVRGAVSATLARPAITLMRVSELLCARVSSHPYLFPWPQLSTTTISNFLLAVIGMARVLSSACLWLMSPKGTDVYATVPTA